MILYLVYRNCNIEGLDDDTIVSDPTNVKSEATPPPATASVVDATADVTKALDDVGDDVDNMIHDIFNSKCKDTEGWYVEDISGKKHYCSDIGKTASCGDMDASGREGWEYCLKTCGNCVNTQVTRLPQNILASFSGDPIEQFGVVLGIDSDRQWLGKQDGSNNDVRGYIDEDKDDDISNIIERLSSIEDIFDIITGNVKECNLLAPDACKKKNFPGCNKQCISCPSVPTPSESRAYIKQTDGTIQFPAIDISCKSLTTGKDSPIVTPIPSVCQQYFLFDQIGDDNDTKSKDSSVDKNKNKITLYDMCPRQCGSGHC